MSWWWCWKVIHKKILEECYNHGDMSYGHQWRRAIVSFDAPVLFNKRKAMGAYFGNDSARF